MLGYISSTRKKSCRQCVKAKRRCDLGFPCCKRCFTKGLDCAYPNASVREAEVVIRQATPDLAPNPPTVDVVLGPTPPPEPSNIDPALLHSSSDSGSGSSPEESYDDQLCPRRCAEPRISKELLPTVWAPSYLNDEQVMYTVSKLCSFVPALAYTGCNTYIHQKLYDSHQPKAFQDSCALAALYQAKTKQNIPIITNTIDNKINALIATSHDWPLTDHLAAVQALIVYQIMRLFDPELSQQEQADRQNRLLEVWTAHLWKRSFNEPATFKTCWDAWVFYESLRRTVLMSVFLRGGWSAVTKGGLCDQVPVLARLPMSRDDRYWDIEQKEFERKPPCSQGMDCLVSYGDWSWAWEPGSDMKGLTDFQRLLLAPCRGKDDPRLCY